MAKASEDLPQRFPDMGKLGIAVLEHLVEKTIGQAAIDEAKKPYIQKELTETLGQALERVEKQFIREHTDKQAADALRMLPVYNLPQAGAAIWAFYQRPNDRGFAELLTRELKSIGKLSTEQVDSAVESYVHLLKLELSNVEPELREKINTQANIESAATLREILRVLREGQQSGGQEKPPVEKRPEVPTRPGALPAGSYLPFVRNSLFTGRVADMRLLESHLLGEHPAATLISQNIQGMGGVGKTQLAVEFAFRYGYRFRGVHWLDLHDPEALDSQIARCGAEMGLRDWPREQPEQVRRALDTWRGDGPRLIILDNFEDEGTRSAVLRRFQHPSLRLLITSRRSDWPATLGVQPLPLEVFSEQESLDFLRKYLKPAQASDTDLKALAERLGYLPLALELAGRYLEKHPRLGIEEYLSKLALEHDSLRARHGEKSETTEHDLDLLSTFALSWQQVSDEAARQVFISAGYCAPNAPIPLEIFEQGLELERDKCDEALGTLRGLGLLKEGPAMHPLLGDYARLLDEGKSVLAALVPAVGKIANARNHEVNRTGNYSLYAPLLPHVRSLAGYGEREKSAGTGLLWNSLGLHLRRLADYTGAKIAHEHALRIAEAEFGSDQADVATYVNNLGSVLRALGDLAGARAAYERALHIDEETYGSDHPLVAMPVNNLGGVLEDLGDLAGARAAYERALRIGEAAFGLDHPQVAIFANNLGGALRAQGDLAGARAAYERALRIDEKVYGPDHPEAATDVNNLGSVLQPLGDLAGARAAFERALRIGGKVYGPDHPNVAIFANNLGMVLQAQGDLAGARAAYERALRIDEKVYGPDHPNVARDVNNLGLLLQDLGDPAGARAAYERALRMFREFLPEGHPNIKTVEGNLQSLDEEK